MKILLAGIQWTAFIFASSIVAPIAVASLFGLSGTEAAGFVQRTMFVLGVAGLLQILLGHRLPVNEGPAGLWWGVFALYAGLSETLFNSQAETLRVLQGALFVSGVIFILLSAAGLIEKISRLFSPVVTGAYLLLLVLQLSKSFLAGMLGIGFTGSKVDLKIAGLSIITVVCTFYLTRHRNRFIRQFGVLIAIAGGWILFAVFGETKPVSMDYGTVISLPKLFAFGPPIFDAGMTMTAVFVTLLLLTNMIASIRVVESVVNHQIKKPIKANLKASGFVTGINQMIGGAFGAIGPVPISGAAGFISATGASARLPFLVGSLLVIVTSFIPGVMGFLVALPVPVGYAVMFAVFTTMIGIAFSEIDRETETSRIRTVLGVSLISGVGLMFVPPEAFTGLPPIIASLLNNGLIFGSIVAIITDQFTRYFAAKKEKVAEKDVAV
ncbi:purine/pyrimidine permease [Bacillus sp. V5-8f]|uniref:purine/pyrimidine permease n=1 Tax=Bacillus sp. V5-8f TaxID=2053044 RepID=UPI000C7638FE|nr:purine/pyrimidine permease [Bacillus sp. V5-8f]PLT32495.1 purine permease [Bacillus sp. V5-8f]